MKSRTFDVPDAMDASNALCIIVGSSISKGEGETVVFVGNE